MQPDGCLICCLCATVAFIMHKRTMLVLTIRSKPARPKVNHCTLCSMPQLTVGVLSTMTRSQNIQLPKFCISTVAVEAKPSQNCKGALVHCNAGPFLTQIPLAFLKMPIGTPLARCRDLSSVAIKQCFFAVLGWRFFICQIHATVASVIKCIALVLLNLTQIPRHYQKCPAYRHSGQPLHYA